MADSKPRSEECEEDLVTLEKSISAVVLTSQSPPSSLTFAAVEEADGFKEFREGGTMRDFKKALIRKAQSQTVKKKKRFQLSRWAWLFLFLALLQAVLVSGIQISIIVVGDFNGQRLEKYVQCVEEELSLMNMTLPDNSTFPSFGQDKQIYVVIFMLLTLYNFGLCIYAIVFERIIEVFAFVLVNIFLMIYGSIQVYQFRGFGEFCDPITTIGWLALANTLVLMFFTVVFCFLLCEIYIEFGWKVYRFVNCNPALRYYYRIYAIYLSIVKLLIAFTIAFLVGQDALILPIENYEFWLSYPFMIGLIIYYFIVFLTVRRESHIGTLFMLVVGILLIAYYGFKIFRYVTRSCPVCVMLDSEVEVNGRREDFQHLIMMSSLNIVISLVYTIMVVIIWRQYGRGLRQHFYIRGYWFDTMWAKAPREDAYQLALGTGALSKLKESLKSPVLPETRRYSSLDEKDYHMALANNALTPMKEFRKLDFMGTASKEDESHANFLLPIAEENERERAHTVH